MKLYIIISILALIFACHDGNTNVFCGENTIITDFPTIQTPKSERINIEIMGLNNLYVVDTFLIAFKASGYNDFFEIYSTNDFRYLGNFLSKGRGPNEFLSIQYYDNYSKKNKDFILWISDNALQKRAQFNLTQSIKKQQVVCDTIFRNKFSFLCVNINDSIIMTANPIPGNIEYQMENTNTKETISGGKFFKSFLPKTTNNNTLSMGIVKHPTNDIFACIPNFFNQINFFSPNQEKHSSVSYQQPINILTTTKQPDSLLIAYYSTYSPTSKYIYALYANQKEILYPYWQAPIEIHAYNWEGKPMSKIIVPDSIVYFAVDEKHQCIYGINAEEEIFRYKINM